MCESVLEDEIFLRTLLLEDAVPMLEWMKNPSVCEKMQFNFANQTLEKCQDFIRKSWSDETNVHFAITNNKNEYLGTVSLKNIDLKNSNAEFAIVIRPEAMGKGISAVAMKKVMSKAFFEFGLNKVYLYVRSDNQRAVKFYQKNKIRLEGCFKEHFYAKGEFKDLLWFAVLKCEYEEIFVLG